MHKATVKSTPQTGREQMPRSRALTMPPSKLPLHQIRTREPATRRLSVRHVKALANSIKEVGLLHPIVVDECGQLMAGAHRLAALRELKTHHRAFYAKVCPNDDVPVRVMPLSDIEDSQRHALMMELSENEKRRNYSRADIVQLAGRLRDAGYKSGSGKMAPGEKHIGPALAVTLGRSLRTVRRLLGETQAPVRRPDNPAKKVATAIQRAVRTYLAAIQTSTPAKGHEALTRYLKDVENKVELLSSSLTG